MGGFKVHVLLLLKPAHALHAGISYLAFVCLCIYLCVQLQNISKILYRPTLFLVEDFFLAQGGNHWILIKIAWGKGVCVCGGGGGF